MPVLVAAVLSGLLALASYAGSGVLALAVVGAQAVLAYGIVTARAADPAPDAADRRSGDTATRGRIGALILATGAASVLAHRLAEPDPSGPTVAPALWVLGPAVVLAMLLELARRDGRARLVESLAATVTGVALAAMLALLVAAEDLEPLRQVSVVFAAAGALVGVVVWGLATASVSRWRWPARVLAVAVVVGAGLATWLVVVPDLDVGQQLVVGGVAGLTGLVGAGAGRQLGAGTASRAALMPTIALALTAPAVYLATRLLFW